MVDRIVIPGTNGKSIPSTQLASMGILELLSFMELSEDPFILHLMNKLSEPHVEHISVPNSMLVYREVQRVRQ